MSIRRQMLLVLGLATVLPLVLTVWVGYTLSQYRLRQRANQALASATRQFAAGIDALVHGAVAGVRRDSQIPIFAEYLALPPAARAARENEIGRLLRSGILFDPDEISAYGLLDPHGIVLADTNAGLVGRDESAAAWVQAVLSSRRPYRSATFEPQAAPGFWIAAPIVDAGDRLVGLLRLGCAPAAFRRVLDATASSMDTPLAAVVLDARYRTLVAGHPDLAHPPMDRDGSDRFVFPNDPEKPGAWVRWSSAARGGGELDRLVLVNLEEVPWHLASVQTGAVFQRAAAEFRDATVIFTAILVVLVIVGANLVAGRLTRPVQQLAATAQRLADGDLSAATAIAGRSEVAQTAQAINLMTERLRKTLHTLERQASEAQLSERRLRDLLDVSPVGITVTNDAGELLQLNRKFIEMFGYAPDELRTLNDWWPRAFPHASYRTSVQQDWAAERISARERGEETKPFEATVTCKDGTLRVVEFRSKDLGGIRITVCVDLTPRRRAELALHASEERHRLLLDHAPEAVVVFDCDSGRFVDCNPAATRLFGLPRTELLNRGPIELSPTSQPDGRPSSEAAIAYIAEALSGGKPVFQWMHRDREGHDIPCEIRLMRFPDAADRRLIRGSIVDISARKHAEDTLRASEERYRLLIENSTELVAQVDLNGTLVYVSPNHHVITGYHPEEMIGTCVFDYIHADDVAAVLGAFQSAEEQISREFRFRYKDGSWHWVESSARRFRTSSGTEMGAVISRDITERVQAEETRKHLESQLRHAQKMEAVGTLAGGIAHDFNNVLTGILCNTQLAEYELSPEHPARSHIAGVSQAARRARDLVAKILTFSRRSEQQFGLHAITPVVGEALDLLRASLPATIDIRRDLGSALPPVHCDPSQIHQVVMNLCANAAHAMEPRGGQLTVRLAVLRPGAALVADHPRLNGHDCVRLTVQDTGRGMDAPTRERIFEPFFTTKPVGEGTGLGLAVVHGIVEDHHGAITVDSRPGVGTTFEIWLPAAATPAPATSGSGDSVSPPAGRGEKILIVDDEADVSQATAKILTRLGYQAAAFTRPAGALEAFRADPTSFAAVISDLTMPGLTGTDLVRELQRVRPDVRVLITTGYMRGEEMEHVRALGVQAFLQKPFTFESLATSLHRVLGRA